LDVDAIAIDLTGSYIGKLDDKILDSLADQVFEHVKNLNAISLEKIWRVNTIMQVIQATH